MLHLSRFYLFLCFFDLFLGFFVCRIRLLFGADFLRDFGARICVIKVRVIPNKSFTWAPWIWVFPKFLLVLKVSRFSEIHVKISIFLGLFRIGWMACAAVRPSLETQFDWIKFHRFWFLFARSRLQLSSVLVSVLLRAVSVHQDDFSLVNNSLDVSAAVGVC